MVAVGSELCRSDSKADWPPKTLNYRVTWFFTSLCDATHYILSRMISVMMQYILTTRLSDHLGGLRCQEAISRCEFEGYTNTAAAPCYVPDHGTTNGLRSMPVCGFPSVPT